LIGLVSSNLFIKCSIMDKTNFGIAPYLVQLISSEQAYHYSIVPFEAINGNLKFKSDNPSAALKQELQIVLGKQVELILETPENIQRYLATNFRKQNIDANEDLHYTADFLEKLLLTAKNIGSSDIHFEPYENRCRVR